MVETMTLLPLALEAKGVSKSYGRQRALDALDFRIERNAIVGLVGPNGAGKSTFFKIVLGLARADSGSVEVLGLDHAKSSLEIRKRIGFLPGDLGFYPSWTGRSWLEFCIACHDAADLRRGVALANALEVPLDRKIKTYSSGMRQKLGILQAIASNAELLILDEPSRGLDPTSQEQFLDLLREEKARGKTILLSSHALGEVDRVADRIEFIGGGRLLDREAVERVREEQRRRLKVSRGAVEIAAIEAIAGVASIEVDGLELSIEIQMGGDVAEVAATLLRLGVLSLEYNRPSLDEIYRRLYLGGKNAVPR